MIALIALVAVVLASGIMLRRSRDFRARALSFDQIAQGEEKLVRLARRQLERSRRLDESDFRELYDEDGNSPESKAKAAAVDAEIREHFARLQRIERAADLGASKAVYHRALAQKYLNASRHPWLSVPSDSPAPE